jgi:hypothetical protein
MLVIIRNADQVNVQDDPDPGVVLTGRCLIPPRSEFRCHAIAISPYAISLRAPVKVEIGRWVVVYLSAFGRFRGPVVQHNAIGFEIALQMSQAKREKLAEQLNWYLEREASGWADRRLHERVVPVKQLVVMRIGAERRPQLVRIDNISRSGANLSTSLPPSIGTEIIIADSPAVVVRTFEGGFACKFDTPFDLSRLDENLRR